MIVVPKGAVVIQLIFQRDEFRSKKNNAHRLIELHGKRNAQHREKHFFASLRLFLSGFSFTRSIVPDGQLSVEAIVCRRRTTSTDST